MADTNTSIALTQPDGHPGDPNPIPYLGHLFEHRPIGLVCRFCGCINGTYDSANNCNPPQTPMHQTDYERELANLTLQLIRTFSVRLVGHVPDAPIPAQHTERFRLMAAVAVALCETNALQDMKMRLAAELCDDREVVRDVPGYTREVIDNTVARLMALGGAR